MRVLVLVLVALQCVKAVGSGENAFDVFRSTHKKIYNSVTEREMRRQIFTDNLDEIVRLDALNPFADFAVNAQADLTMEEWRRLNTGYNGYRAPQQQTTLPSTSMPRVMASGVFGVTPKVDWRDKGAVDPFIFTQGDCGCCWAISVTQTVGSQYFLKKNLTQVPSLSFQQLICCDCGTVDAGCHGGDPHLAYDYIQKAGGLQSEASYPFTDSGPDAQSCNLEGKCSKCKFDKTKVVASIKGYTNVTQQDPISGNPGNETTLAEVLATEGPLSVCINSDPWRFYSNGILSYGARKQNHCVQLVGYDSTGATPYWILKNSWGEKWGEKGYIRMAIGMDICGVADAATLPII